MRLELYSDLLIFYVLEALVRWLVPFLLRSGAV